MMTVPRGSTVGGKKERKKNELKYYPMFVGFENGNSLYASEYNILCVLN